MLRGEGQITFSALFYTKNNFIIFCSGINKKKVSLSRIANWLKRVCGLNYMANRVKVPI